MQKIYFLSAVGLLLLSGCGGGNLAQKHLKLLSEGKAGAAQSQYCSLKDDLRVVEVNSYELEGQSEVELGTEYTFTVDSPEVPKNKLAIVIADSDDFFDFSVASNASLEEALATGAELLGEEAPDLEVPVREDVNQDQECVFLPFEQFSEE